MTALFALDFVAFQDDLYELYQAMKFHFSKGNHKILLVKKLSHVTL